MFVCLSLCPIRSSSSLIVCRLESRSRYQRRVRAQEIISPSLTWPLASLTSKAVALFFFCFLRCLREPSFNDDIPSGRPRLRTPRDSRGGAETRTAGDSRWTLWGLYSCVTHCLSRNIMSVWHVESLFVTYSCLGWLLSSGLNWGRSCFQSFDIRGL